MKVNLGSLPLSGRKSPVYFDPDQETLQKTSRGRLIEVPDFLRSVTKGEARKVRKALRRAGYARYAAIRVDGNNLKIL